MDPLIRIIVIFHVTIATVPGGILGSTCNQASRIPPTETLINQIVPSPRGNEGPSHECLRQCNSTASPMTCRYNLEVEWYTTMSRECYDCPCNLEHCSRERCITADGVPRPIVTANRALPGQPIEVCLGDRIIVDVINSLDNGEGITLHWHGLIQRGTPYMDGVGMINQCPIHAHTSFRYEFMADKIGTHWWHAHTDILRVDGLSGPLIVRQPEDDAHSSLYDYDLPSHTVFLSDWNHETSTVTFVVEHHRNIFRQPKSMLINGKAQYATYVNTTSNTQYVTPREVFTVQQGKRYRFRVIIAGFQNVAMKISVDGHNLTLISSDGEDIQPVEVDAFVGHLGERYDFVLNASNEIGNYWLKVVDDRPFSKDDLGNVNAIGLAIVRYEGAPETNPAEDPSPDREGVVFQKWNEPSSSTVITTDDLRALENTSLPEEGKLTAYVVVDYSQAGDDRFWEDFNSPQLNDRAFVFREYPLLSQYDDDQNDGDLCDFFNETIDNRCREPTTFCKCTQVLPVELNQPLELVLINEGRDIDVHPLHLHGHAFHVLAQEKFISKTTREDVIQMDKDGLIIRNYDNPPKKDTVIIPSPGYTVIEFVADNPGWWFFHCHVEFHAHTGMALVIRVGDKEDIPPVPPNFPRCGNYPAQSDGSDPTGVTGSAVIVLACFTAIFALSTIILAVVVYCQCKKSDAGDTATTNLLYSGPYS